VRTMRRHDFRGVGDHASSKSNQQPGGSRVNGDPALDVTGKHGPHRQVARQSAPFGVVTGVTSHSATPVHKGPYGHVLVTNAPGPARVPLSLIRGWVILAWSSTRLA